MARGRSLAKLAVFSIPVVVLATSFGQSASAQEADLVIPLDTVIVDGGDEGTRAELAEASSGPLEGETCAVRAVHRGEGTHQGNSLIVISGANSTFLADVERVPEAETEATVPLTLADIITVELEIGPDSAFDGDIDVEFDCSPLSAEQALAAESASGEQTSLPVTGGEALAGFLLAVVLITSGSALLVLARRRAPRPNLYS
jgi:hypothetical protein